MNQLVEILNDEVITTSKQVAEVFGKGHKNVMRDIRSLCEMLSEEPGSNFSPGEKFEETTYKDKNNQSRPMYIMNRDAFTLLVMGYTTKSAMKFKRMYIQAFNQMEQQLKLQTQDSYMIDDPVARAQKWIEEQKERKALQLEVDKQTEGRLIAEQQVAELKPKADYTDKILQNKSLVTITQIAKDYGMSGQEMNRKLHKLGVQYKQGDVWLLYSKHQHKGWTQSETHMVPKKDGTEKAVYNTKWTQKGRLGIYQLLKDNGIVPLIEQDN